MSVIKKEIRNAPHPWANWIMDGSKVFEGRLNRKGVGKGTDWNKMKIGQLIEFFVADDQEITFLVQVTELQFYNDFGEAFDNCGSKLVPIENVTREKVIEIYCDIFKLTNEEIREIGVVIVGIKLV